MTLTAINRLAIDLYAGDPDPDFAKVYASGIRLVIHKASEGVTLRDQKYASRKAAAKAAGLLWGAYHFGRGTPVVEQVATFLAAADPDPEMHLALDWEVAAMEIDQAKAFVAAVDLKIGRPTILYSYSSFLRDQLGTKPDTLLGGRPLWLAQYSKVPPIPQASWDRITLWQYTDGDNGPQPQEVPGINGAVDCNHFDGTEDELRALWLGSPVPAAAAAQPGA